MAAEIEPKFLENAKQVFAREARGGVIPSTEPRRWRTPQTVRELAWRCQQVDREERARAAAGRRG